MRARESACKRERARFLSEQEQGKDESARENQEGKREKEIEYVCVSEEHA